MLNGLGVVDGAAAGKRARDIVTSSSACTLPFKLIAAVIRARSGGARRELARFATNNK